ncbi:endonuclease/exonuclease/phosphatase family protein [Mitsuaria sp. GD03876]|uniref:endonuclease/exonuclease/phosphatase family protein n=1 Tax=Mitsuaria sp. GD03876 TaxID=2975399 RepID=UPI002448DCCA|nr:endonuclease/exonuclease/phosphatase family protein [Mitsuaria sp. GD03876]MDH0864486.1 endonuclease/exonuclease/phosphatase family protein [Mitsuaria sp. GD03876]
MQLTLAWWNAALSPTRKGDRATTPELSTAANVIRRLIEAQADVIVLCEVSERDIAAIEQQLLDRLDAFSVLPAQRPAGASRFDTAVLHRRALPLAESSPVLLHHGSRTFRAAQRFSLRLPDATALSLYASHWPSRIHVAAQSPLRSMLGQTLRAAVADELHESPGAPLILMGDFNDEPFDPALSDCLLSSRDREFVEQHVHLLYNPFWRHMTSFEPLDPGQRVSDKGSYFHGQGDVTRWRTFDQMMVSASLLTGRCGWRLSEAETRVVADVELMPMLRGRNCPFDHLPILGRIFRSTGNE